MNRPVPEPSDFPTAVLAEDEPLLADELIDHLSALWPPLKIVARVTDGAAAINAVEHFRPTVAFLDIHMPRLTGLDVARQIAGRCHVAFITAFDHHAIEAFEAGAIDYVLKPFTAARLLATVQRMKVRLEESPRDLSRLLGGVEPSASLARQYLQWISATRGAAVRLITVEDVLYFKSDSKYTLVATGDAESLIKKTIKELADELDPAMFWQVHRSVLVNVHAIDSVIRDERANLVLRLKGRKETLPVAEAYSHLFRQM